MSAIRCFPLCLAETINSCLSGKTTGKKEGRDVEKGFEIEAKSLTSELWYYNFDYNSKFKR